MTRARARGTQGGKTLLDLMDEATENPPLCSHGTGGMPHGWSLDVAPDSPYYRHWVHADPNCLRPNHRTLQPLEDMPDAQ